MEMPPLTNTLGNVLIENSNVCRLQHVFDSNNMFNPLISFRL